jgi:choline dehydrogenase-like flavoprotein
VTRSDSVDVLIIGSGPTGSAYARTILGARPEARVLMVEVGPVLAGSPGRHVRTLSDPAEREAAQIASQGPTRRRYSTPTLKERAAAALPGGDLQVLNSPGSFLLGSTARQEGEDGLPNAVMSSNVGGMGAHWTGACPTPGPSERIPWFEDAVWDRALADAEELLSVTRTAYGETPEAVELRSLVSRLFGAGRPDDRRVQPMPLASRPDAHGVPRPIGTDSILGDLLDAPEAAFELRSETLVRRVLTDHGRATGAELEDLRSGRRYTVQARFVVVAADSLRTPQLLFASGVRPSALGHYLNDHHNIVGAVAVSPELLASVEEGATPSFGVSWLPFAGEAFPFSGMISQASAAPNPLPEGGQGGQIVELNLLTSKQIRFEDRLEFSDSETDWYGMPTMRVHYRLTELDWRRVEEARSVVARLGQAIGQFLPDELPTLMPFGNSRHYQGTVRMGEVDDGSSVCDPSSRVWGTENLFVAGNGVIPTETACNPTLTSVALATVGARTIAAEL